MKETVTVKNVVEETDGFLIEAIENYGFFLSKENAQGVVPKVGDVITLYIDGGSLIRGKDINSEHLYFKTDEELKQQHEKFLQEEQKRKEELFKKQEPMLSNVFALLPKLLQHRIELFRKFSPNFRVESESYELSAVLLAYKIYTHCKATNIDDFESKVDKFDIVKYAKTHWFLSQNGITFNQANFAKALATVLFRDCNERNIDIEHPKPEDLPFAGSMNIPDSLSPLRESLCWPREGYIKDYIKTL